MSEFKGTKGKWEYMPFTEDSNGYISIDIPMGIITVYNGHFPFNMTEDKEKCVEISESNAKLIACAPEMLEFINSVALSENTPSEYRKAAKRLIKKATE